MRRINRLVLMISITISLFGVGFIILLVLNPRTVACDFSLRKPLVGSIFGLLCIAGVFATLFPTQCSGTHHLQNRGEKPNSHKTRITSHHPACKAFAAHVIQIGNRTLCAACAGLLMGAFLAFAGTVLYFFVGWTIVKGFPAVLIGITGIVLGFSQLKFGGFVRMAMNAFFVLGAFFALVGVDGLAQNLFVDLFMVVLIVFWLFTRILLSKWDHSRICQNCGTPCEID